MTARDEAPVGQFTELVAPFIESRHGRTDTDVYLGSRLDVGEDFGGLSLYEYLGDPDSGRTFTFRRSTGVACNLGLVRD